MSSHSYRHRYAPLWTFEYAKDGDLYVGPSNLHSNLV
jgi:hypothetical protein